MNYTFEISNKIIAGVERKWTETFPGDYSANNSYSILLSSTKTNQVVTLSSTVKDESLNQYEFTLPANTDLNKGLYNYQYVKYVNNVPVDILASSLIQVEILIGVKSEVSLNQQILTEIEKVLLSNVGKDAGEITIPKTGVSIKFRSLKELNELRLQYLVIVEEENRIKAGLPRTRIIGVRI
jgi:hypothetical protein